MNESNKTNLKKITKNAGMTFINKLIFIILGMVSSVFLARLLGPEKRGVYAMVVMLPSTLSLIFAIGIPSSNVYHVAKKKKIKEIIKFNNLLGSILIFIGIMFGVLIVLYFSKVLFPGIPKKLLLFGLLSYPLFLINSFMLSLFLGLQEISIYNRINLYQKIFSTVLIVVASYFWGIMGAIASLNLTSLFLFVQCKARLRRLNVNIENSKDLDKKEFIKYGLKSYFSDIVAFLNYKVDIFFINFFLNPASTGIYVVAVSLAEKIWIVTSSVSLVTYPKLAEISDDEIEHTNLTILTAKWVFYLTLIIVLFLGFTSKYIINILYGVDYSQVTLPFILLLPGICLGSMSKIISNSFASLGKPEINLYMGILVLLLNVSLNIILIPKYGLIGGAIATSFSYSTVTVSKLYILHKLQHINTLKVFIFNKTDLILIKKLVNSLMLKLGIRREI